MADYGRGYYFPLSSFLFPLSLLGLRFPFEENKGKQSNSSAISHLENIKNHF
jgi:hypothetical protein